MTQADHDIIVIGAGTAGLSAARAAAEAGARVLVIERLSAGGQVSTIDRIVNFPGQDEIGGFELGPMLQDEAEDAGAALALAEVTGLTREGAFWRVATGEGDHTAQAVIVACGSTRRALGVPGEESYTGRGVSHCASCDGGFFRGQTVIVAGGGDSALDEALVLAGVVGRVLLVHRGTRFDATQGQAEQIMASDTIEVLWNTTVTAVSGDETGMTGVALHNAAQGTEQTQSASGLFVYTGLQPNAAFLEGIADRDADGRLLVTPTLQTTAPALYAAGDLRVGSIGMLSEAVTDGQRAARSAVDGLQQRKTAG
ncbi:NAD(P)/FAD-dependent oxidoreductase [Pararhodobacter zhoushanensis]|uniref:NAD(P)/FAD-dependent oxidoreductase n=1 Tax=Pararhodobacter zhoushanensis TaxID=2479545 RepID=UPI000F8CE296|nr:FAD-dependent oxidoreductase [Pararhodobacter zhoushanensis]